MFSAPPKDAADAESEGIDPAEFQRYFVKHGTLHRGNGDPVQARRSSPPNRHTSIWPRAW